ncbi:MAG: leucine-rich repeat protein [Prevotella sp.]|nr:leucine-rich repeat protein [Prevotella sp.]
MKQNISKLFATLMAVMLSSVGVQAEIISESCGEASKNLNYVLDTETGELTITYAYTGSGHSGAYLNTRAWTNHVDASAIRKINLPDELMSIDQDVFRGCSMSKINIPKNVSYIHYWAFNNCKELAFITVDPENATFDSRDNCNAVIETATNKLVVGCSGTTIPASVTTIGSSAFYGSNIRQVKIQSSNSSLTEIMGAAFSQCYSLETVSLPASVRTIGTYAFAACSALENFTIDGDAPLTVIPERIFSDCKTLKKAVFPRTVTEIGNGAFNGCTSLSDVGYELNRYKNVKTVGSNAFNNCSSLTQLKFEALETVGKSAFSGCSSLTEITAQLYSLPDYLFDGCTVLSEVAIDDNVKEVGRYTFRGCKALTTIYFGSGLTSIGDGAFQNSGLTSAFISESVTSIGQNAFSGCTDLTAVTCGAMEPIAFGSSAFNNINASCKLIIPFGTADAYTAAGWTSKVFMGGVSDTGAVKVDNIYYLIDAATHKATVTCGGPLIKSGLVVRLKGYAEDMVIPSSIKYQEQPYYVTAIKDQAFMSDYGRHDYLMNVTIPASMLSIGTRAFSSCPVVLHVLAITPPALSDYNSLGGIDNARQIFVPVGLEDVYKNADVWKKYESIIVGADLSNYENGGTNVNVGDVNGDGVITIADVTALVNIVLGNALVPGELSDVTLDYDVTLKPDANYTPYYIPLNSKVCNALQLTASQIASKLLTSPVEPQNGEVELVSYDDGGVSALDYSTISSGGEIGYWYDADGNATRWSDAKLAVYFDTSKQKYTILLHPKTSTGCTVTVKQALIYKDDSGQTATATINFHITVDEAAENAATLR